MLRLRLRPLVHLHDIARLHRPKTTLTGAHISNAINEINDRDNFKFLRESKQAPERHDLFNIERFEKEHKEEIQNAAEDAVEPTQSLEFNEHASLDSFLDTNEMVEELKKGGFTAGQADVIMQVTRDTLQKELDWVHTELAPKVDLDNESYLFQAAHNELSVEVTNAREIALMNLQNSSIILKRMLTALQDETSTKVQLNDDVIKMELSQFKHENNLRQRALQMKNTDLNNRIISELMSGLRSSIEQFRWELTRAGIFAIMMIATIVLSGWRFAQKKRKANQAATVAVIPEPELAYRHEPADEESHYYEADLDESVPILNLR